MKLWPHFIFVLLGVNFVVVGVTLYFALSDSSFAVEPDYYRKALAWDQSARQLEASARLGWKADIRADRSAVQVNLSDATGAPLVGAQVEITCFAHTRAADRSLLALAETQPGLYTAPATLPRPGRWQFRLTARRGDDTFLTTTDLDVP
jgi:nitrogen fixation protein FixH